MRIATIVLAALALAAHADEEDAETDTTSTPSCTQPAAGAVDESMPHDVVWTRRAGYHDYYARVPKTEVAISLKHLVHSDSWNCFRWDVELLLPDGVAMRSGSSSSTGNGRDDVARFEVTLEHIGCESGEADCEPAAGGGRGEHWRYPVTFIADR